VQLYRYFVSQSSEVCRHNPLCCFSTSVYCCKYIFHYQPSLETFVYTLVYDNTLVHAVVKTERTATARIFLIWSTFFWCPSFCTIRREEHIKPRKCNM